MKGIHSLSNIMTGPAALRLKQLHSNKAKEPTHIEANSAKKQHYEDLLRKVKHLQSQQVFGKSNYVFKGILVASQYSHDLTVYVPNQIHDELKALLDQFTFTPRKTRLQRDRTSRLMPNALRYCVNGADHITVLEIVNRILSYLATIDFDSIDSKPIDFLPNFNSKHVGILKDLNINTDRELEELGPYRAFFKMKQKNQKLTYSVLYRIYGALNSRFYLDLSQNEKSMLVDNYLEFADHLNSEV